MTYLNVSAQNQVGEEWSFENSLSDCPFTSSCVSTDPRYTFGKSWRTSGYIMTSPVGPSHVLAGANATAINVRFDPEFTVCNSGTSSCYDYQWGVSSQQSAGATVNTRLYIQQMDAAGTNVCATTYLPSQTGYTTTTIADAVHHLKIYYSATVSLNPSCGKRFVIKMLVGSVSGNPVQVEAAGPQSNIPYSVGMAYSTP